MKALKHSFFVVIAVVITACSSTTVNNQNETAQSSEKAMTFEQLQKKHDEGYDPTTADKRAYPKFYAQYFGYASNELHLFEEDIREEEREELERSVENTIEGMVKENPDLKKLPREARYPLMTKIAVPMIYEHLEKYPSFNQKEVSGKVYQVIDEVSRTWACLTNTETQQSYKVKSTLIAGADLNKKLKPRQLYSVTFWKGEVMTLLSMPKGYSYDEYSKQATIAKDQNGTAWSIRHEREPKFPDDYWVDGKKVETPACSK